MTQHTLHNNSTPHHIIQNTLHQYEHITHSAPQYAMLCSMWSIDHIEHSIATCTGAHTAPLTVYLYHIAAPKYTTKYNIIQHTTTEFQLAASTILTVVAAPAMPSLASSTRAGNVSPSK